MCRSRSAAAAADEAVGVEQSRRLVSALKNAGANVRYIEYPDTDHVGGAQKAYADPEMIAGCSAQRRKSARLHNNVTLAAERDEPYPHRESPQSSFDEPGD